MPSTRGLLRSLFTTPGPGAAVSIAAGHVTAVQIEAGGKGILVRGHARKALPDGAVAPAVQGPNLANPTAVASALDSVLEGLARRPRRIALLLPDGAAKVSMLRFANVPTRVADLDGMIRWQVRKTVPFSVDEAQVDWSAGRLTANGEQEFLVVLAHRAVVEEYEQVCTAAGAHPGLVDLLSFSLIDVALAHGAGEGGADWLLVHIGSGSSTLAVMRGRDPLLFRTVAAEGESLGDLVHQTAMYYEDRLGGGGLSCALVAGGGATRDGVEGVRRVIEDRLAIAVEPVAARLGPQAAEGAGLDAADLDGLVAPIGALLRDSGSGVD